MDSRSFNLLLTNLFIGLFKGDRLLHNYSLIVKELQYLFIGIEKTIVTRMGNQVTPELFAVSGQQNHAFQAEWTALLEPSDRKRGQLERFLEVTPESFNLHLSADARFVLGQGGVSTLLVVLPHAEEKYAALIDAENEQRLMLCTFSYDESTSIFTLSRHLGHLQDTRLSDFLQNGINVDRIPLDYTYHVIEELENKNEILKLVITKLVAFYSQGKREFTLEEMAISIYGRSDTWQALDDRKRRLISRNINSVLRDFRLKCRGLELTKTGTDELISWRITSSPALLNKLARKYIESHMVNGVITANVEVDRSI